MEHKHTPGPWIYKKNVNGSLDFFGENGYGVILCDARLKNQEANARLIAAAPCMLDALEFATQELQLVSDEQDGRFGKTVDRLLAVIDKATGETE